MQTKHRVLLFFLHLLALLALLEPIVSYFLSFSYKHLMLPVALLVAIVDWSTSPAATMSRVDRLLYGVLTAVAGLVLYFTPFLLPRLPQFLDPTTHPVVGELMETAWSSCEIGLVLLCLFWRLGTVAGWIKAIAVGISGGGLLTFFLTYPIYMLGLHYIVDGFLFSGPRYTMLLIVTLTAAFIILVTIGPVAAWHAHSNALGESVLLGVLAGGVAGFVVMGILGAAFAGVVANIPLYPVALSRAGFTESQWVGKMALGVNQTYPVTMILFWILIGGGLLMGG